MFSGSPGHRPELGSANRQHATEILQLSSCCLHFEMFLLWAVDIDIDI
jgi:hypothetical protein